MTGKPSTQRCSTSFPAFTPADKSEILKEVAAYFRRDELRSAVTAAVLRAWGDIERAKDRPEAELRWPTCAAELGILEARADGGQSVNFNKLKLVADPELRRAALAAAWKAHEERHQPPSGIGPARRPRN
jgi:hypothetical protein